MKSKLILAFLFAIFLNKVSFGHSEPIPDSLFAIGKYSLAAYEYEKAIFNNENDTIVNELLLKKAYCYKNTLDFNSCYINLNRIKTSPETQELYFIYSYEKALCLYMLNNFSGCNAELNLIEQNIIDTTLKNNCLLLKTLNLCELEKFEESKITFEKLTSLYNMQAKSDSIFLAFKNLNIKNERKAKILSMIFPGLGQFYAKKPTQGISSILLEGLAVTYCVASVMTGYYFTAMLTGFSMSMRLYKGGQTNSVNLVKKHNAMQKQKLVEAISNFALKNLNN